MQDLDGKDKIKIEVRYGLAIHRPELPYIFVIEREPTWLELVELWLVILRVIR